MLFHSHSHPTTIFVFAGYALFCVPILQSSTYTPADHDELKEKQNQSSSLM